MNTSTHEKEMLRVDEWKARKATYSARILPWVTAFRKRRERGLTHPVHDFLFEYYQCKRKLITEWHPPIAVILEGEDAQIFLSDKNYSQNQCGVFLDPVSITEKVISRIEWIRQLIQSAQIRPSQTNCYGLH